MKKQVAIIFGGKSPEYSVSLVSARAVIEAVDLSKNELWLVGISQNGSWYHYQGPIEFIETDQWEGVNCRPLQVDTSSLSSQILIKSEEQWFTQPIDVAFPVLHGANGEDGNIQGLLELAGIPYVGCPVMTSAIGADKYITHRLVESLGIKVTPSISVKHKEDYQERLSAFLSRIIFPLFVKPVRAGSSLGITKVLVEEELAAAIQLGFEYDDEVMIEVGVTGFEVGCGIMGNQELVIGAVDEIQLADGFFDFTEKYQLLSSQIHCPARIDKQMEREIQKQAAAVYHGLKCRGLARVDFFLESDGQLVFNEINTMPGFTAHSRFPTMLKEVGWTYAEIIQHVIDLAIKEDK